MNLPLGTTRRRWLALCVAGSLAVGACQPAPSGSASPGSSQGAAATAPAGSSTFSPRPSPIPPASIPLADALHDAIDVDAIGADLQQLADITARHGGTRPAGSDAHDAAAEWIAEELRTAGYEVRLEPVDLPAFAQDGPSRLEIVGGPVFEDLHDFKAMLFSAPGNLTAPVYALGFDPKAQPGGGTGLGCEPGDWAAVPAGTIVLVQPAPCRRHDVVVQAQAAGALALITAYPDWTRDQVLRPTLIEPADIRIPAIGTPREVGQALADAAAAGAQASVLVQTRSDERASVNVIAESTWGDPDHVVMLGGHLDSVVDGPGSNDDGSGTMTVLEIGRELARLAASGSGGQAPAWRLRLAFWTGEEIGLWGSRAYVQGLDSASRPDVYLNLDMTGSPNGVRLVYDGSDTSRPQESLVVSGLFSRSLDADGLVWQSATLGGSSDHFSFDQAGIPTGGLFSGANEHKTAVQAGLFGGKADLPDDACYHLACDTPANVDSRLLGELARVAAWVTGALASGTITIEAGS